jgi:hypothetical protein
VIFFFFVCNFFCRPNNIDPSRLPPEFHNLSPQEKYQYLQMMEENQQGNEDIV